MPPSVNDSEVKRGLFGRSVTPQPASTDGTNDCDDKHTHAPLGVVGDTSERTIEVWTNPYNAAKIAAANWNLQFAKSVARPDGTPEYNLVWQSIGVAADFKISWKTIYGFNFTTQVPSEGMQISISGSWQQCNLGDCYELNNLGFFVPSTGGSKDFMNVKINYKYPGTDGVHMIVGVKNGNTFNPIYIDTTALPPKSSSKYQPQESVSWWYQTGSRSATMITEAVTERASVDLSKPAPTTNQFYYSSTYDFDSGSWACSENSPPQGVYAPPSKKKFDAIEAARKTTRLHRFFPGIFNILFSQAVPQKQRPLIEASVNSVLKINFKGVKVNFVDNRNLMVSVSGLQRARPGSFEEFAYYEEDGERVLGAVLKLLQTEGLLDSAETWTFT